MTYQIRDNQNGGYFVITPRGEIVDAGDPLIPRNFKTREHAQAWVNWRNTCYERRLTMHEKRALRTELAAKIGLTYVQAVGFFN